MRYLLLIYGNEAIWAGLSEEERGRSYQEYVDFNNGIDKSGHCILASVGG